jgi:hypothetical protein
VGREAARKARTLRGSAAARLRRHKALEIELKGAGKGESQQEAKGHGGKER